jgi:hypothetical protein
MKTTNATRFSALWKYLDPGEFARFRELLITHGVNPDQALTFCRARLVVALGFPLGMGMEATYWHADHLTRDHGEALRDFMEATPELRPFLSRPIEPSTQKETNQ